MNKYSIDLFLEACGSRVPLEFEIEDHERRQIERRVIHQPFAIIGRDLEADLPIDHEEVSHRHAYLQLIQGRLFVADLASRGGTFWDELDQSAGWLDRNHAIRVGPASFRLLKGGTPLPDPGEPGADVNPLSTEFGSVNDPCGVTLEFVNLAADRPPWRLNRALAFIGRSPLCRVQLASQTVSKFHASLVQTAKGVWIVDLLGKDGTYVNGVRVRSARLDDGDRLRIGKFVIRVLLGSKSAEPRVVPFVHEVGAARLSDEPPASGIPLPAPRSNVGQALTPAAVAAWEAAKTPQVTAELLQKADLSEASWLPLVNQFGQMQQQMFDQFQQALMMMVQMFSNLHKDQMSIVRQELDRLHQLTRELHALQGELSRARQTQPARRPTRTTGPGVARSLGQEQARASVIAESINENGNHVSLSNEQAKPAAQPPTPSNAREPLAERPLPPGGLSDEAIHAQLNDRIAALQREQQGLWQRIVSSLVGKRDEPMP